MKFLCTRACLALCLGATTGCSFLIDVDRDQCQQDSDCAAVGFAATCEQGVCVREQDGPDQCDGGSCQASGNDSGPLAGDGGGVVAALGAACVGDVGCEGDAICFKEQCALERDVSRFVCQAPPEPVPVATVRLTMPVRDYVTEAPLANLEVLGCQEGDVTCANPVARFDDPNQTGDVVLDLPYGFAGYLEVRSSNALTSLWYFTKPMLADMDAKVLKAVSAETVELLAQLAELELIPDKGIVILEAFDCEQNAAGGIHFDESKGAATPFFIIDGLPNAESMVSIRNELDNQAAGGFINADPGFTIFTARIGTDGPMLGTFNATVRPNTVTYLDIHP